MRVKDLPLFSKRSDHFDELAALPFFLMLRAAIRAKVTAARLAFCPKHERHLLASQAKSYFAAARAFLRDDTPKLVAVGGLSGSGKSTVAAQIAAIIGRAPGTVILRSDIIRKNIFYVSELDPLAQRAYSASASQIVYERVQDAATQILKTGHSIIAEAVFSLESERIAIEKIAEDIGFQFVGLWLDAPEEVLIAPSMNDQLILPMPMKR